MKTAYCPQTVRTLCLSGVLAALFCLLPVQPATADNEFRIGALLQVPFTITGSAPVLDHTNIRLGLTCQYADVENDKIITDRFIDNYYAADGSLSKQVVTQETVRKDSGNQVFGLEGNLFFEIFNNWNGTVEFLGFYGSNSIQGALGAGYSFAHDLFLVGKIMLPYSEVGLRYMYQPEIFVGIKTFGSFDPETSASQNNIFTNK